MKVEFIVQDCSWHVGHYSKLAQLQKRKNLYELLTKDKLYANVFHKLELREILQQVTEASFPLQSKSQNFLKCRITLVEFLFLYFLDLVTRFVGGSFPSTLSVFFTVRVLAVSGFPIFSASRGRGSEGISIAFFAGAFVSFDFVGALVSAFFCDVFLSSKISRGLSIFVSKGFEVRGCSTFPLCLICTGIP